LVSSGAREVDVSEAEDALRNAGVDLSRGAAFGPSLTAYPLPGVGALEAWRQLRDRVSVTRRWPLLLGGGDSLATHLELFPGHSPADVIAKAEDVDVVAFFASRAAEFAEAGELQRGGWPDDATPSTEIGIHLEVVSRKPMRQVFLILTPTPRP
jgi:hypothetical protein